MQPTLTDRAGHVPGSRLIELDCPHGTTSGLLILETPAARILAARMIAEAHERLEHCGCAARVRPAMPDASA